MKCPRDGTELARVALAGVELDKCHACDGLWLDPDELQQLREAEVRSIDQALELEYGQPETKSLPVEGYMRCPRCGERLSRVAAVLGQVVEVDRCVACRGFWLDAGEADTLAARPNQPRRNRSAEAEPAVRAGQRGAADSSGDDDATAGHFAVLVRVVRTWLGSSSSE